MTFRLAPSSAGANPINWNTIQDLIGEANIPIEPDAAYSPYQELVTLGNGQKRAYGLPSATWILTITGTQKYTLRQICAGTSANVYIETQTNNYDVNGAREWIQAAAIMEWQEGEEEIDADITKDFTLRFAHLVEVI